MEFSRFDPPVEFVVQCHSCGAFYSSTFHFDEEGGHTNAIINVFASTVSLFAWIMWPLSWIMQGMVKKAMLADIEDLKRAAEATCQVP